MKSKLKEFMCSNRKFKIVYCTPGLYMAGGVERVLTLKANYFAENYGYDITIVLTEGKHKPIAYPLSDKVKLINLDINFEELWTCSFVKKIFLYLRKQRIYKKKLTAELMRIRPDITDSLLRREINFLSSINDGSKKIGELHVNRLNYRNFELNDTNVIKKIFSWFWMRSLIRHLKCLDRFVVLTEEDRKNWPELDNVISIPNPITFDTDHVSNLDSKHVLAVGRYAYQKGYDMLLAAWAIVEKRCPEWELFIYGQGERKLYEEMVADLHLNNCHLKGSVSNIQEKYLDSSLFVISSRFEGLSMSLLEAMSFGLPVVSFACPCGFKDVISSGVDGVLVPEGNVELLAERIVDLINNPELRKEIGKNANVRSLDFKLEVLASRWKQLFENLY